MAARGHPRKTGLHAGEIIPWNAQVAAPADQNTKAGAKLKPGNTGAFASNSSLPLHFPFTG
jgi:hypothetical protein